jgi:hypothetical protein
MTIPGTGGVAEEDAYTTMFLLAGLVALVGAVAVLRIPRRGAEVEAEAEAEPALA